MGEEIEVLVGVMEKEGVVVVASETEEVWRERQGRRGRGRGRGRG